MKSLRELARNFTRIAEDIEHWPEDESLPAAFDSRYLDLRYTGGNLIVEAVRAGYLRQFARRVAWYENRAANEGPLPRGKARILRWREKLFVDVIGSIGRLGPYPNYERVPVRNIFAVIRDMLRHGSGHAQLDETEAPNLMRILADPASDQASRRYAARCIRVSTARLEAWVADHLADMIEREAATPAASASASASTSTKPGATYTVADVLEMAGVSNTTWNRYAKLAGVKTPQRGKRNHRYSADEVRAILQMIINKTADRAMKQRCQGALAKL